MKIILTQNVPNLGSLGDEIQVKDGYARNFLLPKGMAMLAGGKNAREIQHRQHFLGKQRAEAIAAAQGESDKVAALELTVKVRSGTGGRLFGSVTNRDLQALIAEQGFDLDRKAIQLHTPVKSLGTFGATIKLHTDVKVELQFKVVADNLVEKSPGEESGEPAGETPEDGGVEAAEESTGEGAGDAAGDGTATPAALDTANTTGEAMEPSAGSTAEKTAEKTAEGTAEKIAEKATEKATESTPEIPPGKGGDPAGEASSGETEAKA
ncbi:MAG: 50S ribosomal protein L9 [SAR324 cluster bacterium]|nr:50S ribosomal protein L9 [SAR324 cluster bacterium]